MGRRRVASKLVEVDEDGVFEVVERTSKRTCTSLSWSRRTEVDLPRRRRDERRRREMASLKRLREMDFYRRVPRDLTEPTLAGGTLSVMAAACMAALLLLQVMSAMRTFATYQVVVDTSEDASMTVHFNLTFPKVSCELLSVDVVDVIGMRRVNVTANIKKYSRNIFGQSYQVGEAETTTNTASRPVKPDANQPDRNSWQVVPEEFNWVIKEGSLTQDERKKLLQTSSMLKVWLDSEKEPSDEYKQKKATIVLKESDGSFQQALQKYDVLVVDFHAPWCHWCARLDPIWQKASFLINHPDFSGPKYDMLQWPKGQVAMASVDCTANPIICQAHHIHAYPSIRVFRRGVDPDMPIPGGAETWDEVIDQETGLVAYVHKKTGRRTFQQPTGFAKVQVKEQRGLRADHRYESYNGERTVQGLVMFALKSLHDIEGIKMDPSRSEIGATAGKPGSDTVVHSKLGCTVQGFVNTSRVPGSLRFSARSPTSSVLGEMVNMTHTVQHLAFGDKAITHLLGEMTKIDGGAIIPKSADWFFRRNFISLEKYTHHEHYLRVVKHTVVDLKKDKSDTFDFSISSHSYQDEFEAIPAVVFKYELSPLQVVVQEERRSKLDMVTGTCAIIGGVFTVSGILQSVFVSSSDLYKKMKIGKFQ